MGCLYVYLFKLENMLIEVGLEMLVGVAKQLFVRKMDTI